QDYFDFGKPVTLRKAVNSLAFICCSLIQRPYRTQFLTIMAGTDMSMFSRKLKEKVKKIKNVHRHGHGHEHDRGEQHIPDDHDLDRKMLTITTYILVFTVYWICVGSMRAHHIHDPMKEIRRR
ncbi:hypothetical protein IGI04_035301, partial [Brassica rapa subsp. trilocularis]